MKHSSICVVLLLIGISCKENTGVCFKYEKTLNGYFASSLMEGTWRFVGGKAGTIVIRGLDYNDMDCSYQILNCETGEAHMNCEGAGLDKKIKIISEDEIEVGDLPYKRVKQ